MGVWGTGIYSSDFTMDLRSTVGAVARLPFESERLLNIICEAEPGAAGNPEDPDHTNFWLTVADQFAKRGIACETARQKALQIIDEGSDIAMVTKLGMTPLYVKKRQKMLMELRRRLMAEPVVKKRPVLKKPQPFLMEVGDVYSFPTSRGEAINSYFPSKDKIPGWRHDGWGIFILVDRGRAFDFLAWYRPLTIAAALPEKPSFSTLNITPYWILKSPATVTSLHMKRLELEKIGQVRIDDAKFKQAFPIRGSGIYQAVNDISIVKRLHIGPGLPPATVLLPGHPPSRSYGRQDPGIFSLSDILTA